MKLQPSVPTPVFFLLATLAVAVFLFAPTHAQQGEREFTPSPTPCSRTPDPDDWLMWRRTLNTWGFSPLDQIDRENVAGLRMVWTRPLGPGLQQGTPLVYDGVLYHAEPARHHPGDRRGERRPDLGASAAASRRSATT